MKPKLHYFAAFVALNVFAAAVPALGNAPQGPPDKTPDNTPDNTNAEAVVGAGNVDNQLEVAPAA